MSRIARDNPDDPEAWDAPIRFIPTARLCKCSHPLSGHYLDRKGRHTCGIAVCGCVQPRPQENGQ